MFCAVGHLLRKTSILAYLMPTTVFAIALELDPEFFVNKLQFEKNDQSWLRCMAYYDEFTPEEHAKRGGVWFQVGS